MLACVSATIFGRDVVPEVVSTSATSRPRESDAVVGCAIGESASKNTPAGAPAAQVSLTTRTPVFRAAATAGESSAADAMSIFTFKSERWDSNSLWRQEGLSGAAVP